VTDTDARLWHPWLRINRVLRVMLHTRWSAEASAGDKTGPSSAVRSKSQGSDLLRLDGPLGPFAHRAGNLDRLAWRQHKP
jgi:hypothetical protein